MFTVTNFRLYSLHYGNVESVAIVRAVDEWHASNLSHEDHKRISF